MIPHCFEPIPLRRPSSEGQHCKLGNLENQRRRSQTRDFFVVETTASLKALMETVIQVEANCIIYLFFDICFLFFIAADRQLGSN